ELRRRFLARVGYSVQGFGPYHELRNLYDIDKVWLRPADLRALPIFRLTDADRTAQFRRILDRNEIHCMQLRAIDTKKLDVVRVGLACAAFAVVVAAVRVEKDRAVAQAASLHLHARERSIPIDDQVVASILAEWLQHEIAGAA